MAFGVGLPSRSFKGLWTAVSVSITSLILSLILGLIFALFKMSKYSILRAISGVYVNIFRGIPALVSVIWVYFGWSLLFGQNFTVYQAGVIALTLLYSAFFQKFFGLHYQQYIKANEKQV